MADLGGERVKLSPDAGIVLGLAGTAVGFADSRDDEAERWLRALRMHGRVGEVLQALGVPEAPLMSYAASSASSDPGPQIGSDPVDAICRLAAVLADARSAERVGTVDVLFAVLETYGQSFDRALYVRGTSREELIERLGA